MAMQFRTFAAASSGQRFAVAPKALAVAAAKVITTVADFLRVPDVTAKPASAPRLASTAGSAPAAPDLAAILKGK